MFEVVEMHAFRRQALEAGMTEEAIREAINIVAANPQAGDKVSGSGGCHKLRFAREGEGKSGGFRLMFYFSGVRIYMLAALAKSDSGNFSKAERNAMKAMTARIHAADHEQRE